MLNNISNILKNLSVSKQKGPKSKIRIISTSYHQPEAPPNTGAQALICMGDGWVTIYRVSEMRFLSRHVSYLTWVLQKWTKILQTTNQNSCRKILSLKVTDIYMLSINAKMWNSIMSGKRMLCSELWLGPLKIYHISQLFSNTLNVLWSLPFVTLHRIFQATVKN